MGAAGAAVTAAAAARTTVAATEAAAFWRRRAALLRVLAAYLVNMLIFCANYAAVQPPSTHFRPFSSSNSRVRFA